MKLFSYSIFVCLLTTFHNSFTQESPKHPKIPFHLNEEAQKEVASNIKRYQTQALQTYTHTTKEMMTDFARVLYERNQQLIKECPKNSAACKEYFRNCQIIRTIASPQITAEYEQAVMTYNTIKDLDPDQLQQMKLELLQHMKNNRSREE